MIKVMGIDPGVKGGLAIIKAHDEYECWGFATLTKRDIADLIKEHMRDADICYVEKVWGRPAPKPKKGEKSPPGRESQMFNFGASYGHLLGILDSFLIKYELVPPQTWQKYINVPPRLKKTSNQHKRVLKEKAQQLFPLINRVTEQTADALLIAKYGFDKEN